MMKGQQEPSVPLPGQSRSHRCGTCEGKVKGVKKEEMGFWKEEKPKILIWLSSSGFSDLENTGGSSGQDERCGIKVIVLLWYLEMMLYLPAGVLLMLGGSDIIPAPPIFVPSILSVQPKPRG